MRSDENRATRMQDDKGLILLIDAYSPETMPLTKLAAYMADFAALLGTDNAVHFAGLDQGSTKIKARILFEDIPKVMSRLTDIRRGNPPKDAAKAFEEMDIRLANDNATAAIRAEDSDADLLAFPGRTRPKAPVYGPFNQDGHLDGLLISVGGKGPDVRLRLQNGDMEYSRCETTRSIARALGKHLFEPVRIHGTGRWRREENGAWMLVSFRVHRFEVMETASLRDTVTALRAVQGSGWSEIENPLLALTDLRNDEDNLH